MIGWLSKTVGVNYSNLVPHVFKPSVHYQEFIIPVRQTKLTSLQIENLNNWFVVQNFSIANCNIENCNYREMHEIVISQKYGQILIPNITVNPDG